MDSLLKIEDVKVGDWLRLRVQGFLSHHLVGSLHLVIGVTKEGYVKLVDKDGVSYIRSIGLFERPYKNPPHKHKDLIIAYANGADIEVKYCTTWEVASNPSWYAGCVYRIKPDAPVKSERQLKIEELERSAKELEQKLQELKEMED